MADGGVKEFASYIHYTVNADRYAYMANDKYGTKKEKEIYSSREKNKRYMEAVKKSKKYLEKVLK